MSAPKKCFNCQNSDASRFLDDVRSGSTVCTACGEVLGRLLSVAAEWREFEGDSSAHSFKSRVGPAQSIYKEIDLSTNVKSFAKGSGELAGMVVKTGGLARRHQNVNAAARTAFAAAAAKLGGSVDATVSDRPLMTDTPDAFVSDEDKSRSGELRVKMTNILQIMELNYQVAAAAQKIFASVEGELVFGILPAGRTKKRRTGRLDVDALAAAIVFIACKEMNADRTLEVIGRRCAISPKAIRTAYKAVAAARPTSFANTSLAAENLTRQLGTNDLGLPPVLTQAAAALTAAVKEATEGHRPASVAAACLSLTLRRASQPPTSLSLSLSPPLPPTPDSVLASLAGVALSTLLSLKTKILSSFGGEEQIWVGIRGFEGETKRERERERGRGGGGGGGGGRGRGRGRERGRGS
jgi:transcription initiation factor TFIIIB Brf1 subunit/transcription initiation factor TFIIB